MNIIELAEQVGFERIKHTNEDWVCFSEEIEAFAALVAAAARADEREACADIAENWNSNGSPRVGVAAQIRARGTT
jgi:hypothetical protein